MDYHRNTIYNLDPCAWWKDAAVPDQLLQQFGTFQGQGVPRFVL